MRLCPKCGLEKNTEMFSTRKYCKDCENWRVKEWVANNKEKKKNSNKKYSLNNKELLNKKTKDWKDNNLEKLKDYNKRYTFENKEKIRAYRNEYVKLRKKEDHLFGLQISLRRLIYNSIKRNGYGKKSKTFDILGCDLLQLKQYLESKFESWMTWDNKGLYNGEFNFGWDIDHIIPLSSAITEYELITLSHYTNLQPLCSKINRDIKKNKKVNYLLL